MSADRETAAKSILGRSALPGADFAANPYGGCRHACRYCFASFMGRLADRHEPWGDFLDVKNWPPVRNPEKYRGKKIFLSSVTDPYQPAEKIHRRSRLLLEQLLQSGCRLGICTKSDLILEDLELIGRFPGALVSWSINTLDENFRRQMDRAAPIARRLEAMRIFHEAGIATACFISPIFPGITDVVGIIGACRDYCDEIWLDGLNLRPPYRAEILGFIRDRHPHLVPLYRQIYEKGASGWWANLERKVMNHARLNDLAYRRGRDPAAGGPGGAPVIINYRPGGALRI